MTFFKQLLVFKNRPLHFESHDHRSDVICYLSFFVFYLCSKLQPYMEIKINRNLTYLRNKDL